MSESGEKEGGPKRFTPIADEDRYRLLIDSITDYAIYMLDPSGIVTSWNPGARRFKGYEGREIIGKHFSTFYTPEDREAGLPAKALSIARTEKRFEGEGWRLRKDGTRIWVNVVIDPIIDSNGALIGYAKVTRDLTERKQSENLLLKSEEQFRLLVQSVTDYAIYMLSPEGIVTNWNSGAERIKGYAPAEIIGSHFSRFYSLEDAAAGEPETNLEIAKREGKGERQIRLLTPLAFVSPATVRGTIDGSISATSVTELARQVPQVWQ